MGVQDIILCTGERAHDSSEALCSYYQRINMVFNELAKNKDLIFQDESMRNADFKLPVICSYPQNRQGKIAFTPLTKINAFISMQTAVHTENMESKYLFSLNDVIRSNNVIIRGGAKSIRLLQNDANGSVVLRSYVHAYDLRFKQPLQLEQEIDNTFAMKWMLNTDKLYKITQELFYKKRTTLNNSVGLELVSTIADAYDITLQNREVFQAGKKNSHAENAELRFSKFDDIKLPFVDMLYRQEDSQSKGGAR